MNRSVYASLLLIIFSLPLADVVGQELPQPVKRILDIRKVPHDAVSVHVRDVDSGEIVVSWEDGVARNPASTMKLITTLVGLDVLGPTYRWKTELHALGDVGAGVLEGDLLI